MSSLLTDREQEVVRLLANGRTGPEIAAELTLGERTVEQHVTNVRKKLGARNRAEVIAWFYTGRMVTRAQ